jgi:serine/threonine protein kinase
MSLVAGTRLGPYEIIAPAGAGGMGEVYKARDTRLERIVAIKVLASNIANNPDLKQRFDREAQAISKLNHASICTLHDVGHQDGIDFLVMEFLDGETLASRLSKGALPLTEWIKIATEIADALDKAHKQGMVHRDLKPGNIMLTKSGAKLMDFGLAKLQQVGGVVTGVSGVTRTTPLTGEGTIVGTIQYMSPEQLEGKEIDFRSDIFSFGAVLYEMATGARAFEGDSQASLIASILKEEPRSISELKPMSPPLMERAIKQCLAKDTDQRWQSAGDLKRALTWVSESSSQPGMIAPSIGRRRIRLREWIGWGAAAALLVLSLYLMFTHNGQSHEVLRAVIEPPDENQFLFEGDYAGPPVVSPDGNKIAFVAVSPSGPSIWIRDLSTLESRQLSGTDGAQFPFWSPDNKSLGYFANAKIMRVDIATGQVFSVCDNTGGGRGGSWGKGDVIIFSPDYQSPIVKVSAAGGTPVPITEVDTVQYTTHRWPHFLPDGEHFLYFAGNHFDAESNINSVWFCSLDGKENHQVMSNLSDAGYAEGYLLYVKDSVLFAQPFDEKTGQFTGERIATKDKVQVDKTTWKSNFSARESHVLAYQDVGGKQGGQLLLLDRSGNLLKTIGPEGNHYNLDLSPDGNELVYSSQELPYGDLYNYNLKRDIRTRLTFESFDKDNPAISPSGKILAFCLRPGSSKRNVYYEIHTKLFSGIGKQELFAKDSLTDMWPMDWSADGEYLICAKGNQNTSIATEVIMLHMVANAAPIPILQGIDQIFQVRCSPDGKWIAYTSSMSGGLQVSVIPFPTSSGTIAQGNQDIQVDSPGRWQISTEGGNDPLWKGDCSELYYLRKDGTAMSVDVSEEQGVFHIGHETELFRVAMRGVAKNWDVTADGQKFVVNALAGSNAAPLVFVKNWAEELRK